uniref:C-type lectin domain-containing protein n=1 Tax=Sinocyclocheilus grahami TaxID=75366 RepID=A0A672KFL4_SINGR
QTEYILKMNLYCDGKKVLIVELVVFTDGWINYQSSLYFISSERKSWAESRRYCTERGADLIIINNREEQVSETNFVTISCGAHVWIGLTDSDMEGRWKWVDGSTPGTEHLMLICCFRSWGFAEPNSIGDNEDCALTHSLGWADFSCYNIFQWICEKNNISP